MESIQVVAKFYGNGSMFCPASTPGYAHVVAIPLEEVPPEFREYLWKNAPPSDADTKEAYFVFEKMPGMLSIADTFVLPKSPTQWKLCVLVLRDEGGLRFMYYQPKVPKKRRPVLVDWG